MCVLRGELLDRIYTSSDPDRQVDFSSGFIPTEQSTKEPTCQIADEDLEGATVDGAGTGAEEEDTGAIGVGFAAAFRASLAGADVETVEASPAARRCTCKFGKYTS